MTRGMIIAAALVLITAAHAEPLPQPKPTGPGGSCPHGYFTSGSYCVPSQGAQDAVLSRRAGVVLGGGRRQDRSA